MISSLDRATTALTDAYERRAERAEAFLRLITKIANIDGKKSKQQALMLALMSDASKHIAQDLTYFASLGALHVVVNLTMRKQQHGEDQTL